MLFRLVNWLLFGMAAIYFAINMGACFAKEPSEKWLTYHPYTVKITGQLIIRNEYGPPGYGENPMTDAKGQIYVLILDSPINVKANDKNDGDTGAFKNIKEIQLIASSYDDYKCYASLVDHHAWVLGQLGEGDTGGQYTKIVLFVKSIESKSKVCDRK